MKKLISLIPLIVLGSLAVSLAAGAGLVKPIVVQLGIHRFDRTSTGKAVALATPDQVGWQLPNGDVGGFGPQTFLVGRDHSIWIDDGLNSRLLVYRAGSPKTVARVVPLKFATADSEVALGPNGSIYTTRTLGKGSDHTYRLALDRQTPAGKLIWESRLPSVGQEFCGALRAGPGGTLYCVGPRETWIPVATPAGRPTSATQRRMTGRQPVVGGLRLVSHIFAPVGASRSVSFTLLDRRGSIVRSWRIFSRSPITEARALDSVGPDPVVVLDIQKLKSQPVQHVLWDYVVLRLGPRGAEPISLRHAVYGDNLLPDLRVGPDGALYQLGSSPTSGVVITRYALRRSS
jgi:hypothetical protein